MSFRRRAGRSRTLVAALPLIVPVLIGPLLAGAPPAHADVSRSHHVLAAELNPPHPPYPPYPPANCLRHYESPTRDGWRVTLAWAGGRSCPRVFYQPAKAEIWMYEGSAAPIGGPWTNGRPVEPAARYGGHDEAAPAGSVNPAATWWERVKTVSVERSGAWIADVRVAEPGPYTFAAVNSISREYVLVEVEVGGDAPAAGAAGGDGAPAEAGPAAGPDGTGEDALRRVGVPTASSVLAIGLALGFGLLRRSRGRRRAA